MYEAGQRRHGDFYLAAGGQGIACAGTRLAEAGKIQRRGRTSQHHTFLQGDAEIGVAGHGAGDASHAVGSVGARGDGKAHAVARGVGQRLGVADVARHLLRLGRQGHFSRSDAFHDCIGAHDA